jgi:hypothetical protein
MSKRMSLERAGLVIAKAVATDTVHPRAVIKAAVIGVCSMEMDVKHGRCAEGKLATLESIYAEFGPEFVQAIKEFVYE